MCPRGAAARHEGRHLVEPRALRDGLEGGAPELEGDADGAAAALEVRGNDSLAVGGPPGAADGCEELAAGVAVGALRGGGGAGPR